MPDSNITILTANLILPENRYIDININIYYSNGQVQESECFTISEYIKKIIV